MKMPSGDVSGGFFASSCGSRPLLTKINQSYRRDTEYAKKEIFFSPSGGRPESEKQLYQIRSINERV
jgi:hypothetical protein